MVDWYCKGCSFNENNDCGPWNDENKEFFPKIRQTHKDHVGWQTHDAEKIYKEKTKHIDVNFTNSIVKGIRTNRFHEILDDITFTIHQENKEITFTPLEDEIKKLRPLSVYDNKAWILIFLPVQGKTVTTKGNEKTQ